MFGYDNERVAKGPEAAVVRDIDARFAAGAGADAVAETLNRVGAPSPPAQQGRPNGWSVSTIREVLKRLTLPMDYADNVVLDMVEGEIPRHQVHRCRGQAQIT